MKNKILYLTLSALLVWGWSSCSDDKPDKGYSIFDDVPETVLNEIDEWIMENYTNPYNIEVLYRWIENESDTDYQLVPAEPQKSLQLMKVIKHLWIEAYSEIAGPEFLRTHAPRQFMFSGTNAYKTNNTFVLGTAEGGQKITFYNVNNLSLSKEYLNRFYLETMHHEFGHILHQKKMYSLEFEDISRNDYLGDSWSSANLTTALQMGFISQYSRKEVNEDFVELLAKFVTSSQPKWDSLLTTAGADGAAIIQQKFEILQNYLESEWGIDIFALRNVVLRRMDELPFLDLETI